jgi:hypothetical protein
MALRDDFRFDDLQNIALDLVLDELEIQIGNRPGPVVVNQEIVLDLVAYALNLLPPMYRTSLLGRVYAAGLRIQYGPEVSRAVQEAIQKIL